MKRHNKDTIGKDKEKTLRTHSEVVRTENILKMLHDIFGLKLVGRKKKEKPHLDGLRNSKYCNMQDIPVLSDQIILYIGGRRSKPPI